MIQRHKRKTHSAPVQAMEQELSPTKWPIVAFSLTNNELWPMYGSSIRNAILDVNSKKESLQHSQTPNARAHTHLHVHFHVHFHVHLHVHLNVHLHVH